MKIGIAVVHYGDDVKFTAKGFLEKHGSEEPFVHLVHDNNHNNIGFSRANNSLIRDLIGMECDWIWLLNNDTDVPEFTATAMQAILGGLPLDVGVVGFQIRSMDDPDLIHHGGTTQCFPAGIHKSGSVKLHHCNEQSYERWVTFASVLIRREVFLAIGLLDGSMVNYFSDSDFCYRARYAGWKVLYEPRLMIYHKIGQSQNPNEAQQRVLIADSLVFQNKWMSGKSFFDLDKEQL